MEIKRKFNISVVTNRRYIIRQQMTGQTKFCSECGDPMLTTGQASGFFGIKQRRIFQIIEADAAHFKETGADPVMICLSSLAAVLDSKSPEKQIIKKIKG